MKRFLKLFPLTLLFCLALALGLVACGGKSYSVTAEFDAGAGSVVLSEEGKDADGKYQEGSSVTVTVTPNAGYAVSAFSVNGTAQTLSGSSYTFTVKEDTKISVTFEKTSFSVTLEKDFAEAAGAAALSAPKSGTTYAKDELVTLTVTVNAGYLMEKVTVGSEEVELEDGKYSFKVKADTAVKVTIRAIGYYKVTVSCDATKGKATVTPEAGADGTYREGTELTLSVTAGNGYTLLSVKVDGSDVTLDENGKYTFNIQKDTTVDVSFEALKTYKVTFYFDTEMCSMSYLGINEEGKEGDISIQPNVATDFYEGETVFTVTPAGGYKIAWVQVNGEAIELSERSFTLDIGEALQNADGGITVAVACAFIFTQEGSLEGEYELTDDEWHSFTLEKPAVFEFSATNYVAYAAFFTMTQTGDDEWEVDDEHPVWKFNDDSRSKYAIHTFEAGAYMARFSASTGDGVASSKLTVTEIKTLDIEMLDPYFGTWKSTDGLYDLTIGKAETLNKDYLILRKDGKTLSAAVTYDKDQGYLVTFGEESYWLIPYFDALGTLAFTKDHSTAETLFLLDPLPSVTVPKEVYGIYSGIEGGDDQKTVDDLTVSKSGITWGDKKLTLLTEIGIEADSPSALVSYQEDEGHTVYYALSFMPLNTGYRPLLTDTGTKILYTFTFKETLPEGGLDEEYWGSWESGVYRLNITASSVTLTKSGEPIDVKVGTYQRTFGDKENPTVREYVSLTFEGKSYYINSVGNGRMSLYSTSGNLTDRMTFTTKFTLTVNAPNATVTIVNPKELYQPGDIIHFTVTPAAGYTVTSVKVNGEEKTMGENGDYYFNITKNTVITVECTAV